MKVKGKVGLDRALSKRGLASRKEARELILAGQVKIDGQVIKDPEYQVVPETMKVSINDQAAHSTKALFLLFHKPKSCVTTTKDERNRKTVYDFLKFKERVISVGRLDYATSGLLFFTNQTRLMDFLTDPNSGIERTYLATVRNEVLEETREKMLAGVMDDGDLLRATKVELRKVSGKESQLLITLQEGKNREIRRLCKSLGHEVMELKRISYGGIQLDLEVGEHRLISFRELSEKIPECYGLLKKMQLI